MRDDAPGSSLPAKGGPKLRVIDGGLSAQVAPKPSPVSAQPHVEQIADKIIIGGKLIRLSAALRQKLASLAADHRTRKRGGAA